MGIMEAVRLKVKQPGTNQRRVWTIASHEDHFGNMVAEGLMHDEEYWEAVARAHGRDSNVYAERTNRFAATLAEERRVTHNAICNRAIRKVKRVWKHITRKLVS